MNKQIALRLGKWTLIVQLRDNQQSRTTDPKPFDAQLDTRKRDQELAKLESEVDLNSMRERAKTLRAARSLA